MNDILTTPTPTYSNQNRISNSAYGGWGKLGCIIIIQGMYTSIEEGTNRYGSEIWMINDTFVREPNENEMDFVASFFLCIYI